MKKAKILYFVLSSSIISSIIILKTDIFLPKKNAQTIFSRIETQYSKYTNETYMDSYLEKRLSRYNFEFNLLPPGNRILIPEIKTDAPIIDIAHAQPEKIENADFDEELYLWVVRHPYTSQPWMSGNILIFWHTSYYPEKHNPYANIFSKIPKLKEWMIINIIRNEKMYNYEIVSKTIKQPKDFYKEFIKYTDQNYLVLMGCYPIWTDKNRMLIFAKEIAGNNDTKLSIKN